MTPTELADLIEKNLVAAREVRMEYVTQKYPLATWMQIVGLLRAAPAVQEGYVLVPKKPERERLISMAVRFDHGFGLLDEREQESLITQMRQLYEEASGQGFYAPEHAERYRAMLAASGKESAK